MVQLYYLIVVQEKLLRILANSALKLELLEPQERYTPNEIFVLATTMGFFFFFNFYFGGNRFSEFLGEMCLGEILGLAILGEFAWGKYLKRGNLGEMN